MLTLLLGSSAVLSAQDAAAGGGGFDFPWYQWYLGLIAIAGLVVAYSFYAVLKVIFYQGDKLKELQSKLDGTWVEPEEPEVEIEPVVQEEPVAVKIDLVKRVPMELEDSIDLGHDYDGIRELDNDLPPWWKALFYITIALGIGHLAHHYVLGTGKSSAERYEAQVAQAEMARLEREKYRQAPVTAATAERLFDKISLRSGKAVFDKNCMPCHGAMGEGIVGSGPNLTDAHWLHGGGITNVFGTIENGVPAKGMQSWRGKISANEIHHVASYILSLEGSNPPGALPPQGEIWTPEEEEIEPELDQEPQLELIQPELEEASIPAEESGAVSSLEEGAENQSLAARAPGE